jgi:hypothetical protein
MILEHLKDTTVGVGVEGEAPNSAKEQGEL